MSAGYTCVHSYVSTKMIVFLQLILEHKSLKLEEKVETLIQAINCRARHTAPEELDEEIVTQNEINIMRLPSQDAYSYGLQLVNIFFSKEELASLLFKSKTSDKQGLDQERVSKLIQYVEKRYRTSWDLKWFISKANQKCCDSATKCS